MKNKLSNRLVAIASVTLLGLVALTACGKKEEAAPVSKAPPPIVTTYTGVPIKIAFAYVGPVGDGGWTFAHDRGRKAIESKFGSAVKTSYIESVPEGADAERVLRDLAQQGNKVIFGTTFGYMEAMLKVARDFPNVHFEHATGYKTSSNLGTYDSRTYQGAYMAGIIAGSMTKSNVLGFVGSVPIPEVIRNINSFTLGAQSVNPKITTKVVWVNEWFNPSKETEAAQALINGGADILMQNTDSSAVLQTAEKNKVRAFGWDSDMSTYAPTAHLASVAINWGPYYQKIVQDVQAGVWKSERAWWGAKEGAIDLVSIAADVPPDAVRKVNAARAQFKTAKPLIWIGPIVDQSGKIALPADMVGNDEFLSHINFYIKGVEGKLPSQ